LLKRSRGKGTQSCGFTQAIGRVLEALHAHKNLISKRCLRVLSVIVADARSTVLKGASHGLRRPKELFGLPSLT
jgi:hypothetical protein